MTFSAFAALNRLEKHQDAFDVLIAGKVRQVFLQAHAALDRSQRSSDYGSLMDHAMLVGDLALTLDLGEAAEAAYHRAVKAAATAEPGQVRVASCRTTGMIALYLRRFDRALSSFRRVLEDAAASDLQRIEAQCGLAMAYVGAGHPGPALQNLEAALQHAQRGRLPWAMMMCEMLRSELLVRCNLLSSAPLSDHAYWLPAEGTQQIPDVGRHLDACESLYGEHELARGILNYLHATLRMADAEPGASRQLALSTQWFQQAGLISRERRARYDGTLAAVTAGDLASAAELLRPLITAAAHSAPGTGDVEFQYCLSKLHLASGRVESAFKCYQGYAKEAMQSLRSTTHCRSTGPEATTRDEVEMSLPAKYRRAYQYMLQNLSNPTLGVRELSESIGVTDRTMQLVFKSNLGLTPMQVVQRARVERIRELLISGDVPHLTVMEAAERCGIRSRSTLVSTYVKFCHETPAQTLLSRGARRDRDAHEVMPEVSEMRMNGHPPQQAIARDALR